MSNCKAFLALTLLTLCAQVSAAERILDYHSDVLIHPDGGLMVTETIDVRSEGKHIRRGIYRDFPTRYKDRYGNHYKVTFQIQDVRRDGRREPYHTQKLSNGVRVYIGSSGHLLRPGRHSYMLRYHTTRQLGFFPDHDELYWNVTGNGWMFPIDRASARIELPADVSPGQLRTDLYTGYQGARGKAARSQLESARIISFVTTHALAPRQGLTVAVGFPKGIVHEPTRGERIGYFLEDNGAALVLALGLALPLFWYLWAWSHYGRDPDKGIIIPRFEPPKKLTPAGCAYIRKMSFRQKAFTAAIVSLGVKGYLEIHEDDDEFTLYRKTPPGGAHASKGELALLGALFRDATRIELKQENYRDFLMAKGGLKKALRTEHVGRLFNLNGRYALPAIIMSVAAVLVAITLDSAPLIWIVFGALSLILHLLFIFLMRAPTPAGRRIMDEIEGFAMYLDTAEQQDLDRMQSPQLTPEVFEAFLPYAYALGVENHWCERFARAFPADPGGAGGYRPAWYVGDRGGVNTLGHLGSGFSSSFSSAISSASSPPGSSSGGGGGGSSGGGGGGGGGGGW